jgi:CDP-paratose 2-epimerase
MHIIITGGAGFIGVNLAAALINDGYRVTLYDILSRPGATHNLAWLTRRFGDGRVRATPGRHP